MGRHNENGPKQGYTEKETKMESDWNREGKKKRPKKKDKKKEGELNKIPTAGNGRERGGERERERWCGGGENAKRI